MHINSLFKNGAGSTDVQSDIDATNQPIIGNNNQTPSDSEQIWLRDDKTGLILYKKDFFDGGISSYNVNVYNQSDVDFYKYINALPNYQKGNKDDLDRALKTANNAVSDLLMYQKLIEEPKNELKVIHSLKAIYVNKDDFFSFTKQLDIMRAFNCYNSGEFIIGDVNSINSIDAIKKFLSDNLSNFYIGIARIKQLINTPLYAKFSTTLNTPILVKKPISIVSEPIKKGNDVSTPIGNTGIGGGLNIVANEKEIKNKNTYYYIAGAGLVIIVLSILSIFKK